MKLKNQGQSGHIHLFVPLIVLVVVAGIGWLTYKQTHKPSKVTDASVRAQLQQTSNELKKINLAKIKGTVDTVNGVQTSFNYKKANHK
ncbi:MAG TPA: hypothetical protein VFW90_00760 [Candidatus Saccharimonadales bacterium]|nr:hypothetical protein [Candidatus Saccharimonadales bacterium]